MVVNNPGITPAKGMKTAALESVIKNLNGSLEFVNLVRKTI